jgi:hypothetical protein
VGDAGDKLAKGRHLFGKDKLLLSRAQVLQGLLEFGGALFYPTFEGCIERF